MGGDIARQPNSAADCSERDAGNTQSDHQIQIAARIEEGHFVDHAEAHENKQQREVESDAADRVAQVALPVGIVRVAGWSSDCRRWLFTICRNVFLRSREHERVTVDIDDLERDVIGSGEVYAAAIEQGYTDLFARLDILPAIERAIGMIAGNDEILTDGFVGVSLSGPIEIETVVSQGCRPIGRTFVITKARENVIEQLGGKPALVVVKEIIASSTARLIVNRASLKLKYQRINDLIEALRKGLHGGRP